MKEGNTPLTVTVKKTMPKITAKAVKLNSYVADEKPLVLSGGTVSSLTQLDGFDFVQLVENDGGWALRYTGAQDAKKSGKVKLQAEPEGWGKPAEFTVSVSWAPVVPKLKFAPSALTLNPASGDKATSTVSITTSDYADTSLSVDRVEEVKGLGRGQDLTARISGNTLTVSTVSGFDSGTARTFKVYVRIGRHSYPVTVKTLKTGAQPAFKVKAAGAIDTAIPNSPITMTVSAKNFNIAAAKDYEIEVVRVKGKEAEQNVTGYFAVRRDGSVLTLTAKTPQQIESGYSYTACTRVKTAGGWSNAVRTKLTIKWSAASKVPVTVTMKAKGSVDPVRPDSFVTLTPTIKNAYGYVLKTEDLIFCRGTGKSAVPITDSAQVPFTARVSADGKSFEIRRAPGASLNPAQKYSVGLSVTVDGRSGKTASPTVIGVKMGKAKFTAAPASIQLLKQDRYSSGTVILSTADAGLSEIAGVFPANANYEVTQIGYGKYAVTYTGPVKSMKNATLKLNVFLEGNGGAKANAVVSLKVKFA